MDDVTTDQAPEQSVADRVASKFGFPNASEQPETQVEDSPAVESDLAELEWEGSKYQVPAKLKDAFMKNEDYTRKTQDLSEQRKSLDHMREVATNAQLEKIFGDSVSQEHQELSVIDAYLQQVKALDWQSMTSEQLLRHKIEVDNIKERRQALQDSISGKRNHFNNEVKTKMGEMRSKARELATKSIPGFNEETEKAMRAFAMSEGLTESEVDNVLLDPRSYKVLWKAAQFDKVQAGTAKAVEKATPVLKPGAANERMPAKTATDLNLRKEMKSAKTSGDKARIIEARLANAFGERR
jgi:hypothetical protein